MGTRTAAWLAWSLAALSVIMFVAAIALHVLARSMDSADGLLWTFGNVLDSYRIYGLARPGSVPFQVAVHALSQWLWVPAVWLFAVYLILLFPDG